MKQGRWFNKFSGSIWVKITVVDDGNGLILREHQRELQGLTEYRAVSDFAHRNRIQSLLRGRFLRNERPVEEERTSSVVASELVQLRQRQSVSGLREGFRSRSEDIVHGQETEYENQDQWQMWAPETDVHQVTDRTGSLETVTNVQNTNQQENIEEEERGELQFRRKVL